MSNQSKKITRRKALKLSGATAGAALAAPSLVPASVFGAPGRPAPSERITMGVLGSGGRGKGVMRGFLNRPDVHVLAVCDVQKRNRDDAKRHVDGKYKNQDCKDYIDFREILVRKDIDTVLIASPDHWHAIMAVEACKHGKDVYCEKPLSLTIQEGRAMVDAARRYNRMCSSGSQRVLGDYGKICRRVQKGELGQIQEVFVNIGGPPRHCYLGGGEAPAEVDWDRWLGPAPWAPYNPNRMSRAYGLGGKGWRTWHDYSGGMMTDWGGHKFGAALFAMGLDETGPTTIVPPDGKDHKYLTYIYENGVHLYHSPNKGNVDFVAPKEKVAGLTWEPPKHLLERDYKGSGGIQGDFIESVKTRQRPFRDFEFAHRVATVCHLGNIAYTLKRPLKWDPIKEEFPGDEQANRLRWRPMRGSWSV